MSRRSSSIRSGARSGDDALDAARRGAVAFVHDARAMEMRGKFGVVGDVVAVREQHQIHAAHFFDAFHQGSVEARGIDQDVAALLRRAHDQVGPRAEARFRSEAAIVDIVHDVHGKRCDPGAGAAMGNGADGCGRARDQRHERAMQFAGICGLLVDAGFAAVIAEARRRDLAAGVAVDAACVDVEFALDILRRAARSICAMC